MGDPSSEETDLGPLIMRRPPNCGPTGAAVDRHGRALSDRRQAIDATFYEPTVLVDVTPDMPVMRDEVFAPVAPVCSFKHVDDAVRMANDSHYGLQSTVFS